MGLPQTSPQTPLPLAVHRALYAVTHSWAEVSTPPCSARQSQSVAQSCPTLCDPMASLSITNSRSLLKLMSIESVMPSSHLILCHPLLLPPLIFPSIRVFFQ